mgnify:CR=1 FL=1
MVSERWRNALRPLGASERLLKRIEALPNFQRTVLEAMVENPPVLMQTLSYAIRSALQATPPDLALARALVAAMEGGDGR